MSKRGRCTKTYRHSLFRGRIVTPFALAYRPSDYPYFPSVCPDWDNEARVENLVLSLHGSTPRKYGNWLHAASQQALGAASQDERIVFVNAWNEWAEGAYLEPDRHYGFAYLAETRRVFEALKHDRGDYIETGERNSVVVPRSYHYARNLLFALRRRLRSQ